VPPRQLGAKVVEHERTPAGLQAAGLLGESAVGGRVTRAWALLTRPPAGPEVSEQAAVEW